MVILIDLVRNISRKKADCNIVQLYNDDFKKSKLQNTSLYLSLEVRSNLSRLNYKLAEPRCSSTQRRSNEEYVIEIERHEAIS